MKKALFVILMSMTSFHAFSEQPDLVWGSRVQLQAQIFDPVNSGLPVPKYPVQCPTVSIDGHTLYLYDVTYAFTLYLLDEEGEVAYTADVVAGTPTVTLPSGLTGDYQLLIVPGGSYYFGGWIEL